MKKLFILLVLLLLIGCSSQKPVQTSPEKLNAQSEETKEVLDSNNPLFLLLEKIDEVPNVKYRYSKLPNLNTETVSIKGDKIKIDVISGIIMKEYSTLYLDSSTKEGSRFEIFGACTFIIGFDLTSPWRNKNL